eukprot:CAMPEP_0116875884 /NCGR_PEP_ID=MMETSP0463-20121206/7995_1 /TAXON_ID=181622 /ORGANISM="Strombidinopsis sp, Strain SopsisLIS2011" /LENGTH=95 /DNA_ID=CAMNT_0004522273 /DNA_START=57 /DNA_END=344 /DNA_ORIENTATION=-
MDAWRQRLAHEDREVRKQTIADLERQKDLLESKNSYINQFKKKQAIDDEENEKKVKEVFLYDKIFNDDAEERKKDVKSKRKDDKKVKYDAIVTTS